MASNKHNCNPAIMSFALALYRLPHSQVNYLCYYVAITGCTFCIQW